MQKNGGFKDFEKEIITDAYRPCYAALVTTNNGDRGTFFQPSTVYTITLTVSTDHGYILPAELVITINGEEVEAEVAKIFDADGDRVYTITYTFDATGTYAEFLAGKAAGILANGFTADQLILSANNNATLTLVLDGIEIVLATGVNNKNVSGTAVLPDGSGTLKFDIKGNGGNVKTFQVIT